PQIKGRYIENRDLNRDYKQVSADHPRAHLVPQRELLGDFRTLINQRFDLEWTVDELVFGKLIDNQLAVVGRIAARSKPRYHVVAAARHHGEHEEELGVPLARQPHDDVIGSHQGCTAAPWFARELPEILSVIKNVSRLHVISLIDLRLNQEEVLGIANVLLQVRRHDSERLEQLWKDPLVCPGDRVRGVYQIKVDGPIKGIDDDLH